MKIDWKTKLSSRKFWAAVSGVVISIMIIFGTEAKEQERIVGGITAASTLVCYILAEGSVDKANINKTESDTENE